MKAWQQKVAVSAAVAWCSWVSNTLVEVKSNVSEIRGQINPISQKSVGGNHAAESKEEEKMNKSVKVHYINKYPGGQVSMSETALDVFCAEGIHRVALRKDGNGDWRDLSEELGACDKHDLNPIPKESRYMKLFSDGKIGRAEEYADRKPKASKLAASNGGKVPSIEELAAKPAPAPAVVEKPAESVQQTNG